MSFKSYFFSYFLSRNLIGRISLHQIHLDCIASLDLPVFQLYFCNKTSVQTQPRKNCTETALIILVNGLYWKLDEGSAAILPVFWAAFKHQAYDSSSLSVTWGFKSTALTCFQQFFPGWSRTWWWRIVLYLDLWFMEFCRDPLPYCSQLYYTANRSFRELWIMFYSRIHTLKLSTFFVKLRL